MANIYGEATADNDCEDQGFGSLSDGCVKWECQHTNGSIRPQFVKVEKYGKFWWCCPICAASYGEVTEHDAETEPQK